MQFLKKLLGKHKPIGLTTYPHQKMVRALHLNNNLERLVFSACCTARLPQKTSYI